MPRDVRVLIVSDRPDDHELIRRTLAAGGTDAKLVSIRSAADIGAELDRSACDVLVLSTRGHGLSVRAAIGVMETRAVDVPLLVVGDQGDEPLGLEMMGEGAADFVARESPARLARALERELHVTQERRTRRIAERELASSEERFRLLAEHAKDIIYRCRFLPERRVEYISPSVVALTGYAPAEYYANPDLYNSLIHPEDRPFLEHAMRSATTSTGPLVLRWVGRNGRVIFTEQSITRILDHEGNVVAIEGIARNVSKRVRIENALRESEQRLQNVLRSMIDPLFVLDTDGVMQVVNPAVEALLGFAPRDLIGMPLRKLIVEPAVAEGAAGPVATLLAGEPVTQLDLVVRAKSGERIPVQLNGSPMRDSGAVVGAVGVMRDMREVRRLISEAAAAAQSASEKADELERAMLRLRETQAALAQSQRLASLGQLGAGIAHDFNNLLTTIFGYTDLAAAQLAEDNPVKDDLAEIRMAATRAAKLVSQLLAFARRQTLQPRLVDLTEFLKGADRFLRPVLGEGVKLEARPDPDGAVVRVDPSQLEQALVNLAANAREAMPDGGTFSIEVANVTLDEEYVRAHPDTRVGAFVRVTVSDTGRGMAPEIRDRVFEPFFTTKGLARASGLGLATCYGIIKQSGGFIWVYSEPGHGTAFKIYLPRVREEAEARPLRHSAAEVPGGSEVVLVVEDEHALRDFEVKTLRKHGYTVLEAADGLQALTRLGPDAKVDLVVTDVIMPRMDGRELADRVRQERPEMRVLFVSGYTDSALDGGGGAEHFLQKPFSPSDLLLKVREALDVHRPAAK